MDVAIRALDALTIVLALCLARMLGRRFLRAGVVIAIIAIVVAVIVRFWRVWLRSIPAKTSVLAKGILVFVQAHPHLSRIFHVFVNMVPDIAYLLLAFAGVTYLMPELVAKIEKRRPLRLGVMTLFMLFGLLAILVNAINRTDQEDKERQLQSKIETQSGKIDGLRTQQTETLKFLANSKGQPNEAERRRQVLETLRGRYVIDHPEVPVTMLTGDSWPPKEWMDKHLRESGETFPFVPPPIQVAESKPSLPPPAIDLDVYVGNDDAEHTTFTHQPDQPFRWEEVERECTPPFRCYPERDLKQKPVEIDVGTKGWARMLFSLFNVGGSTLVHPHLSINLARPDNVLLSRVNQRQAITATPSKVNPVVEYKPPELLDIVPFSQSNTPWDAPVDVTVGPLVEDFILIFRIFGDNMSVHSVVVPVRVTRSSN